MFLRNLNISKKLMLINLIASGFAMILLVSSIALIVLISSENNLVHELKSQAHIIVERIMDISSHLVVNQTALKLKQAPIRKIIDAFALAVKK